MNTSFFDRTDGDSEYMSDETEKQSAFIPLAARLAPASLEEFYGQENILGKGKLLALLNQLCFMGLQAVAKLLSHVL